MDAGDWIALAAGIAGTAVGIVGSTAGVMAARSAGVSARTSQESAEAARRSADEAAAMSGIERGRRHDELAPTVSDVRCDSEQASQPQADDGGFFVEFHLDGPRAYRAKGAVRFAGGAVTPISLPLLLLPDSGYRFFLERRAPGQTTLRAEEVILRFWPPADVDEAESWGCPCGRPSGDEDRGHWEVRMPVTYADVSQQVF